MDHQHRAGGREHQRREFREHLGGELTVTLLEDIGRGVEVHRIEEAWVLDSIAWLKQRDQSG